MKKIKIIILFFLLFAYSSAHAIYTFGTGASVGCARVAGDSDGGFGSMFSQVSDFSCSGTASGVEWKANGSASGRVSGGSLGVYASMTADNQNPGLTKTAPGGWTFLALGSAYRNDTLTISTSGLAAGETGTLEFDFHANGSAWAGLENGSAGRSWAQAGLVAHASNGRNGPGDLPSIALEDNYDTEFGNRTTKSATLFIPYMIGDEILLTMSMTAQAWIKNESGIGTGSAVANFFNSAGVTDMRLLGADGQPLNFTLDSESGEFALYEPTVVPLPAALPLLGSALAGLGLFGFRRRVTD